VGAHLGDEIRDRIKALLAPQGQRTQTLECVQDGEVLAISYDEVRELFFQNPDFGYYFMQLAAARLFHTLELLENQLAERAEPAKARPRAESEIPPR